MADAEKRRSFAWIWWVIGLPLLYVCSIGPIARIHMELETAGYNVDWMASICSIVYWPIAFCAMHNDTALRFLIGYYELWGVEILI